MKKFNILHLSDMHFGIIANDNEYNTSNLQRRDYVLSKLVEKIKEISQTELRPDVIVISGDIGWHGQQSDYILAEEWINKLLDAANLNWKNLIPCVGNHDIDRDKLIDSNIINSSDDSKKQLVIEKLYQRGSHFYEYTQFCRRNGIFPYKNSAIDPNDEIKYLYGYREYSDVCFVVWNTAWNCKGKDIGNLYVGEPLVLDMKSILPKNKIVISAMHHPFYWLNEEEQFVYNFDPISVDGIIDISDIVMNGHVHGKIRKATHYQNKSFIFTSGATYDKNNYHLGCQLVQLDVNNSTYSTKVLEFDGIGDEWKIHSLEDNVSLLQNNSNLLSKNSNECVSIAKAMNPAIDISIGTKNVVKHFRGRSDDLKKINRTLDDGWTEGQKNSLWIYSMGGMGKTQLCRKLFQDFQKTFRYIGWISCNGDFKTSLVNCILQKSNEENLDDAYKKTINYINSLGQDLLLFIDNLDIEDESLGEIELLKCNVIVSSRYKNPDTFTGYELGFLPFKSCKSLFKSFYKIEENIFMNEIIHKTGYLTLAIELLAKTGQKMGIDLESFYYKLEEKGFDIKTVITSNWDNRGERLNEEISKHFNMVFDLSALKDNKDALYILYNMSLFPYLSIDQRKIINWLNLDEESNLLSDLADSGWLQCTNVEYAMHPVISYTIRKYNNPSFDECSYLVSSIAKQIEIVANINFLSSLIFLPFAVSVGDYFKKTIFWNVESVEYLALLFIRISEVYRYNGEYNNACSWAQIAEKSWDYSLKTNGQLINTICNTLSEIYLDMRDKNENCKLWALRAIEEDKIHEDVDDNMRSISYHNLASYYIQIEENKLALEQQLIAVSFRERQSDTVENKIHLANSYRNLAMIYRRMQKLNDAYDYQKKAINILEEAYAPDVNHPDMPVAYSIYSFILKDLGNMKQAIEYQLKATNIRESINKSDPKLAINYNNLGMFYLWANEPATAKAWMDKAIEMDLQNRNSYHLDLATDYFNYSKVLYALNDKENAIFYLKKSKEIEEKNLNKNRVSEINELIKQYSTMN